MKIEGAEAAGYDAIRLDSFASVNRAGALVSADKETGRVCWLDAAGGTKTETLGMHAIRIMKRGRR